MKKILAGLAALLVLGFPALTTQAAESTAAVRVKNKEWKDTPVYLRDGRLFTEPAALAKGGRWEITEKDGAFFVSVPAGEGETASVRLPVSEDGLADLTFFSEQAGLSYRWNEKKKEIRFEEKKNKKKKKKEKKKEKKARKVETAESRPLLVLWDPDGAFSSEAPFFAPEDGERVVSPSWGTYKTLAGGGLYFPISYVEEAKAAGVCVMPLFSNDFDPEETAAFLRDEQETRRTAGSLAAYAEVYGLAGWNMDFENMDPRDKTLFTAFAETLADRLHAAGRKLSVDVTAIGNSPDSYWNACYDRKALAEFVDYEIFMGYDETAGDSRFAGSTSDAAWLERSVRKLLEEVPAEKLVLGLPFYTRVWTGENGTSLSSDVLTLRYTEDFLRRHHAAPKWQKKEGQFYADWRERGVRKRVWLEEARSLGEKISLVEKYHLAGAAFWRYGFEDTEIYEILGGKLKEEKLNH